MPYKRSYKKRRTVRRRRKFTRRRGRRNLMQRQITAGIKMKYTTVFTPRWAVGSDVAEGTISLCGGRGVSAGAYYTISNVNPDAKTTLDMDSYQQACIYGVAIKWFFAEPTSVEASPVQLSLSYSPNELLNPQLDAARMQAMSTFQTMPCNQNRSRNRYYPLSYTKKKLGIDYFTTSDFPGFGLATEDLYGGQLPAATGPSVHFKVYRNSVVETGPACRMQLTYYVRYRGTKGANDLT